MSGRAEMMKLIKELQRQGFCVERSGSGHWKVSRADGTGRVIMSFSPSHGGQHKTLKQLRELGFQG